MTAAARCLVDSDTVALGVRVEFAVIRGVEVAPAGRELERWKRSIQRELRDADLDGDPILAAYRRIAAAVGNPDAVASPEYLLRLIRRHGRLPSISNVVDAYNVVSARTRAVVSAHDLDRLQGPLRMIRLREPAPFEPLGATSETLPAGEFAIRDDRHLLCRMNCKQSGRSSTGPGTRNLLIYAQGNPELEGGALRAALDEVCEAVTRFAGGERAPVERVGEAAETTA